MNHATERESVQLKTLTMTRGHCTGANLILCLCANQHLDVRLVNKQPSFKHAPHTRVLHASNAQPPTTHAVHASVPLNLNGLICHASARCSIITRAARPSFAALQVNHALPLLGLLHGPILMRSLSMIRLLLILPFCASTMFVHFSKARFRN